MKPILMITTVGTEEQANLLAEELVERRQSCCVNILPIQRSVYRWQGKVCEDSEYMLVIKTTEEQYEAVESSIKELHQYDLPEILGFEIGRGEPAFLQWIAGCVGGSGEDDVAEPESEAGE